MRAHVCVCLLDPQEEMRQSVAPAAEPVQYYFTLAQQPGAVQVQGTQPAQQAGAQAATTIQPGQIIIAQSQQGQVAPTRLHPSPPPPRFPGKNPPTNSTNRTNTGLIRSHVTVQEQVNGVFW